jgi:hypothetical protein
VQRLAGIAFLIGSAAAVAGPTGRVIRVERAGGSTVAPRLCEVRGDAGTCVGDEPRPGQAVVFVDENRVVAEVQIIEAMIAAPGCPSLWTVKTRPVRGNVGDSDGIGVIDPGLHPGRAHAIEHARLPPSPSGQAGEEVWRAIDRDGDGAADIVFTRYSCDVSGKPVVAGSAYCIDIWARTRGKMLRTTQLNFAQCNL